MLVLKVAEGKFIYSQYVKEILNQILINIQYSELNVSISKGDHFICGILYNNEQESSILSNLQ
jgi:hypothetical protein